MNEPQEQDYSPAAQKALDKLLQPKSLTGRLEVSSHGHMQNEREKKLAFEREDAMRTQRDEAIVFLRDTLEMLEAAAENKKLNGMRYVKTVYPAKKFLEQFTFTETK